MIWEVKPGDNIVDISQRAVSRYALPVIDLVRRRAGAETGDWADITQSPRAILERISRGAQCLSDVSPVFLAPRISISCYIQLLDPLYGCDVSSPQRR